MAGLPTPLAPLTGADVPPLLLASGAAAAALALALGGCAWLFPRHSRGPHATDRRRAPGPGTARRGEGDTT